MKIYTNVVALLFFWICDAKVHQKFQAHVHSHSHTNLLEIRHGHEELNSTNQSTDGVDLNPTNQAIDREKSNPLSHSTHDNIPSNHTAHSGLQENHGTCSFPNDAGLVAITPGSKNAGWAMSPDQSCSPGSYCPYACPSGQVMAQWNPDAKSYTYPQSMDGGLYCDHNGQVKKPFPEKPYCVSGTGVVGAQNKIGKGVSFCQTVLPGNEAMLIPTHVVDSADLAVPGNNYWCNTAAHYYINPPGVKAEEACVWGDESKPIGNWSPFVAGANTDQTGKTFVKIGWNPIYTGSSLSKTPPKFGVKIVCESGDCDGAPCSIDPSSNGVGGVLSANQATGAGGANFCVVTVPKGSKANIEVFNSGDSESKTPPDNSDENPKIPPSNNSSDKPKDVPTSPDKKPEHSQPKNSDEKLDKLKPNPDQKSEKPVTVKSSEDDQEAKNSPKPDHSQKSDSGKETEKAPPNPGHLDEPDHPSSDISSSSEADIAHEKSTEGSLTSVLEAGSPSDAPNESSSSHPGNEETSSNNNDASSPNKNMHHHQTAKDDSDNTIENGKVPEVSHNSEHYEAHPNSKYTESEGSNTFEPLRSRSIFGFIILFVAANHIL